MEQDHKKILKETIIEFIAERIDPSDPEIVKKFDDLLKQLELQNI